MMHTFRSKIVRFNLEDKTVYMLGTFGEKTIFPYNVYCPTRPMATKLNFWFDMNRMLVLFVHEDKQMLNTNSTLYSCTITRFFVVEDKPIFAVHFMINADKVIDSISESFKEQLASYTLDKIINSPQSESV